MVQSQATDLLIIDNIHNLLIPHTLAPPSYSFKRRDSTTGYTSLDTYAEGLLAEAFLLLRRCCSSRHTSVLVLTRRVVSKGRTVGSGAGEGIHGGGRTAVSLEALRTSYATLGDRIIRPNVDVSLGVREAEGDEVRGTGDGFPVTAIGGWWRASAEVWSSFIRYSED